MKRVYSTTISCKRSSFGGRNVDRERCGCGTGGATASTDPVLSTGNEVEVGNT